MMELEKESLATLTQRLKAADFKDIRYYIKNTRHLTVNVLDGENEKTSRSNESAYFVEAGKNGKRCCTFFNTVDMMDDVMEQMEFSALSAEEDYHPTPLFGKDEIYSDTFEMAEEPEIVETLIETEKVMKAEPKTRNVESCGCEQSIREITLMDDNGNAMTDMSHSVNVFVKVVSEENGDVELAWGEKSGDKFADVDCKALGAEVAQLGAAALHGEPILSGKYPVILKNSAAAELLEAYLPIFYASEMQNNMSKLAGKVGQQIAISDLNLVEDPTMEGGRSGRHFDDEGTVVSRKYLIHGGKFETALYNRKTAEKDHTVSTGNGFKGDVTSSVGTGVTNVAVESVSGTVMSREDLFKKMENGIMVTSLEGVFAGANTVSGSFSLLCKGMVIKNGAIAEPFCKVTIAGNIYDLFNDIVAMGDDPTATSADSQYLSAPSLLLKGLAVSGI